MALGLPHRDNSEYLREMADVYALTVKRGAVLPDEWKDNRWIQVLGSMKGVAVKSICNIPIRSSAWFDIPPELLEEARFMFGKTHHVEHVTGPDGNALMRPQSASLLGIQLTHKPENSADTPESEKIADDFRKSENGSL